MTVHNHTRPLPRFHSRPPRPHTAARDHTRRHTIPPDHRDRARPHAIARDHTLSRAITHDTHDRHDRTRHSTHDRRDHTRQHTTTHDCTSYRLVRRPPSFLTLSLRFFVSGFDGLATLCTLFAFSRFFSSFSLRYVRPLRVVTICLIIVFF